MKTRSTGADLERLEGIMTETDVDKAEVLNAFITSVFTLVSLESIPTFENRQHNTELTDFVITNEEVEKILKTLNTTKPPGPPNHLLRGLYHSTGKRETLTQYFKKGQKHLPGNYSPVIPTSVASKMIRNLVRNEMKAHMTRNNLLSNLQHGFVQGRYLRSFVNGRKL